MFKKRTFILKTIIEINLILRNQNWNQECILSQMKSKGEGELRGCSTKLSVA